MLALLAAALLTAGELQTHPIHTAVTEISYQAVSRTATIRIRVFADDFISALGQGRAVPSDSAMSRYVRGSFALADPSGTPLGIRWLGVKREGNILLLHLQVTAPRGLAKAKVLSALLAERFEDQVNIVRAWYDRRVVTLLFTRGESAKALP
jgi:hypothetical protein